MIIDILWNIVKNFYNSGYIKIYVMEILIFRVICVYFNLYVGRNVMVVGKVV